ncbi:hypothetical protein NQZ68_001275 [Dissostichus eleginoides]|nr:hypothetical protein NQZ68_001275 [Dissostichus eleginoides]
MSEKGFAKGQQVLPWLVAALHDEMSTNEVLLKLQSPQLVPINANRRTVRCGRRLRLSHAPSTGHTARAQPLLWSCRTTTQSTRNSGIRTHSHIPPPSVEQAGKEQPCSATESPHSPTASPGTEEREKTL